MQREHRIENGDQTGAGLDLLGIGDRFSLLAQRDRFLVDRQTVPGGAVQRGEGFELVECTLLLEHMRQAAHGVDRGVDAGAAAGAFLQRIDMGGGVGAEEEALVAGDGGRAQRQTVVLTLGDRQAVVVRLDPADQDRIAVDDQVMGGDRAGKVCLRRLDVIDAVLGGDVFHRHLQFRQPLAQRIEHGLDEHGFAVEDVDIRARDLAMDAERQADLRHALQHRHRFIDVAHAAVRIGRRARRVKLDRLDEAAPVAGLDVVRIGACGEIERHQRLEPVARGKRGEDALAIGAGVGGRHDRRHQVGHDDRAGEMAAGIGDNAFQHVAVAQVKVPIIRPADNEVLHGQRSPSSERNAGGNRLHSSRSARARSARAALQPAGAGGGRLLMWWNRVSITPMRQETQSAIRPSIRNPQARDLRVAGARRRDARWGCRCRGLSASPPPPRNRDRTSVSKDAAPAPRSPG
ncbi:hypothetical protein D9M70_416480 [compost metagenome]